MTTPALPDNLPVIPPEARVRRRGATPKIMISYSRTDALAVSGIAYRLNDSFYYDVWIDYDSIPGGADWREAIARGIIDAQVIVFMASPASCESEWCRAELDLARKQNKKIVPVKLTRTLTNDHLVAAGLDHLNYIDFSAGDGDDDWRRLVNTLPKVLERDRRAIDPVFQKLHHDYLRMAILRRLGKVKLTHLLEEAPKEQVGLLDVYVPLKLGISFNLEVQGGEFVEWWVRDQKDQRETADEYRQRVGERAALPKTVGGFDPQRDPAAIAAWRERLAEAWVEHKADHEAEQAKKEENNRRPLKDGTYCLNRIESETAPALMPHLVITGGPGSGKSTLMAHLALCMAGDMLQAEDGDKADADLDRLNFWPHAAFTPVFIELRALVRTAFSDPTATPTLDKLYTWIEKSILSDESITAYLEPLKDQMRAGEVMFFLDGLDEVPDAGDPRRREQIKALVALLRDSFPKCRILVTSRPHAYQDWSLGDDFGRIDLINLDSNRLEDLALRLFRVVLGHEAAEEQAPQFREQLKGVPGNLTSSPLFFTLLAALWLNNQKLPPHERLPKLTQAGLYRGCVTTLIHRWTRKDLESGRSVADAIGLNESELRALLETLAYQVHSEAGVRDDAVFESGKIMTIVRKELKRLDVNFNTLIETLAQRAGVIFERAPEEYEFAHRSFREHLAARYLARADFPDRFIGHLHADPIGWRNVRDLLPDELTTEQQWSLVNAILPDLDAPLPDDPGDGQWVGYAFACKLLIEHLPASDRQQKLYRPLAVLALRGLVEIGALPPVERAEAGRWLARLGDARPGVGVLLRGGVSLPDPDWVTIPDDGDFQVGHVDESDNPPHVLRLPAFQIARHPITFAQFQPFLDDKEGFSDPRWWDGLAAEADHRAAPGNQAFPYANHPRERVSWYDAIAFCRWWSWRLGGGYDLDRVDQWSVRLPTEWEWEKAARANKGWRYPYDDEFNAAKGNTSQTGIGQTSAVGIFPDGASPYKVLDMSGNVWQWCLNPNSDPPDHETDVRRIDLRASGIRVLRGGSWFSDSVSSRAVVRDGYDPHYRHSATVSGFFVLPNMNL